MTKIYFIRHGQSAANVDESVYFSTFDHNIHLTPHGEIQAQNAGKKLQELLLRDKRSQTDPNRPTVSVFCSPYLRTTETWKNIKDQLDQFNFVDQAKDVSPKNYDAEFEEDPLLREQEHKVFKDMDDSKSKKDEQVQFGKFWYRFRNAESIADVHQRAAIFLNKLQNRRQADDVGHSVVIIAHEITINMLLMNLLRKNTHDYATRVDNCEIIEVDTNQLVKALKMTRHPTC